MKLRWRVALGLVAALAALVAINAAITNSQTKQAEVTAENGRILQVSRGALQVTDTGPPPPLPARTRSGAAGRRLSEQPIVLLHCYACSLHWYDRLEPLLAERHRVIRIDLLGFGGSEKPESGYEIPAQATAVAEALNQLDVEGALVVGNSMGGMVATSLAEQASQLVDRAVIMGMAPNTDDFGGGLPFLAKLAHVPVLGEALWRIAPNFAVRQSYEEAFAPGFDIESGFTDPDQVLADYDAMTYRSFDEAPAAGDEYVEELPLDEHFQRTPVPLLVIFGAEDQVFDAERAIEGYEDVPGAQTEIVDDAGHAPQVERPEEVARLISDFSIPLQTSERNRRANDRKRGRNR